MRIGFEARYTSVRDRQAVKTYEPLQVSHKREVEMPLLLVPIG